MNKKKGFTLVELLVVIVIIGILATLATVALGSARMKARDARRISDVKQIQTALELYYNDNTTYPASNALATSLANYMPSVPTNPTPLNDGSCPGVAPRNSTYIYTQITSGSSYVIQYCLGGLTGQVTAGTHCATPSSIDSQAPAGNCTGGL